jgi:hypothetical protein
MAYSKRRPEQDAHSAIKTSHDGLVAQYRAMANDSEREREAEGWTEELISDSSAQCKSCSKQRLRIKIGSLSRTIWRPVEDAVLLQIAMRRRDLRLTASKPASRRK